MLLLGVAVLAQELVVLLVLLVQVQVAHRLLAEMQQQIQVRVVVAHLEQQQQVAQAAQVLFMSGSKYERTIFRTSY
jgi:hypothetical protein